MAMTYRTVKLSKSDSDKKKQGFVCLEFNKAVTWENVSWLLRPSVEENAYILQRIKDTTISHTE